MRNKIAATVKLEKLNTVSLKMPAALFASITPRVPTSAVSFWRLMKSLSSGGMMFRTACGSTTYRSAVPWDSPSERAADTWLWCTEFSPARYTSETYAEYESTSAATP